MSEARLKRIDEIIYEMSLAIEANYGLGGAIRKITMSHEAFDVMVFDMAKHNPYRANFRPSSINDLEICGIRFEARAKNEA